MSPSSKSKSKSPVRANKEQPKASKASSSPPKGSNRVSANACNPNMGTFQHLETSPATILTPQINGKLQAIDETDEYHSGSSSGTTAEYDSLSNNSSCSGESEDQKEKTVPSVVPRTELIPGADTDKRDKIRQKNEKKHQRQKEKRALELHERCNGYLMSRKLESLTQQLVAMGFPSERAIMALMLNEGRVEDSVAWLFEGGADGKPEAATDFDGAHQKIDIADELARIAEMEVRFKCTKQEVERVVVSCEGDLVMAEITLSAQKQVSASKLGGKDVVLTANQQWRSDERDFSYGKAVAAGALSQEVLNRNLQSMQAINRIQAKPDLTRPQAAAPLEKMWPNAFSSLSASHSLASPFQVAVPPTKLESRCTLVGKGMESGLQAGMVKEPIIVMQRPQSASSKPSSLLASNNVNDVRPTSTGRYMDEISRLQIKAVNEDLVHNVPRLSMKGSSTQPYYPKSMNSTWNTTSTSSPLVVPSSLGLFVDWGSSGSLGSSPPLDWSTGCLISHVDYTCVDWSLDPTHLKSDRSSDTRPGSFLGMKASRPVVNGAMSLVELQGGGSFMVDPSGSVGSHEWTSPFAGKDLFRVPRQFVTSPSL